MIKGRFRRLSPAVGVCLVLALVIGLAVEVYAEGGGEGCDSHEKTHDTKKKDPQDPQKKPTGKTGDIFGTDGRGLTANTSP